MNAFETVLQKARTDQEFAKNLLVDPIKVCAAHKIELNDNQQKMLSDSMQKVKRYFAEQLYILTAPEDVLWNVICVACEIATGPAESEQ